MIFSHSCPNGWRQYYKCKNKEETWLVPNSYRWYNFFLTSFLKRAICYMIKRVPLSSKFRKFSLNKYEEAKIYLFLFDFSPLVSQKLWYLIYFIFPERESMELFSEHILKNLCLISFCVLRRQVSHLPRLWNSNWAQKIWALRICSSLDFCRYGKPNSFNFLF